MALASGILPFRLFADLSREPGKDLQTRTTHILHSTDHEFLFLIVIKWFVLIQFGVIQLQFVLQLQLVLQLLLLLLQWAACYRIHTRIRGPPRSI